MRTNQYRAMRHWDANSKSVRTFVSAETAKEAAAEVETLFDDQGPYKITPRDDHTWNQEYHHAVQGTPDDLERQADRWCRLHAPKKARSFTIVQLIDLDRFGNESPVRTGHASIVVAYYTTIKEGKTPIREDK